MQIMPPPLSSSPLAQFGKVHRGLWRGSVVAVKSMVLPANMSSAEKRGRMAIMEAAISSSMAHPNVRSVCVCVFV